MCKKIWAVILVLVLAMIAVPVTETVAAEKVSVRMVEGDYDTAWGFSEGMAVVEKNEKYGYINQSGEEVVPCQYDWCVSFSEGLAVVEKDGTYRYIDQSGEEFFLYQYRWLDNFREGLAVVMKGDEHGYINRRGEEVIPCQYDWAGPFFGGIAPVYKNRKYGYINLSGEEVIPCQYDEAGWFSEGLAVIEKNGKYGYINLSGEEVIPCQYDYANSFSKGLAIVKINGKKGYINQGGEALIPCQYDDAEEFSEGLAAVEKNGKYGYINLSGEEVIPCQYDGAWEFSEGLAVVWKNNKCGYINQSGEAVIPCQYDNAGSFSEGLACVKKDDKYGYINRSGEGVILCQYDYANSFSEGLAVACNGNQWYVLTINTNESVNENTNDNTVSLQAPTVKTSLVNITQTKLTWNKVSNASGYDICRATSQNGTYKKLATVSSAKTSYIDATCKQGDTYYYKVVAYDASGIQATSDIQSKKIPVVQMDYSVVAPTISSVEKSGKNIVIRWEKITKGNGYVIYRSTDNKNFNVYKIIKGLGTTQLTDKNVKSKGKYFYRIATYYGDTTKQSPISPTYVIKTKELKDDSFKTTLRSVTKKAHKKNTVTLRWKKLSNASGYIIYRKDGNGKYKSLYTINNASKESIDDVNLSSGRTYTYYIKPFRLVDSNGVKIKYLGSASNKISIKE